jgi:ABC-type transport system involved in Fe-S cluster assembly fused permease/ATPase subunit
VVRGFGLISEFILAHCAFICPSQDPPGKALSIMELRILDRLVKINSATQPRLYMLSSYLTKLVQTRWRLARNSNSSPGNKTIWRRLTRLIDIQLGVIMGLKLWVIESASAQGEDPLRLR